VLLQNAYEELAESCGELLMQELSAADWALEQVEAVRQESAKRLDLLAQTYHGPTGSSAKGGEVWPLETPDRWRPVSCFSI